MYPRYHFGWSDLASLTDGRYKFIKAPKPELYDLDRDPDERTNIIGDRASAAAALQSGLESILATRVHRCAGRRLRRGPRATGGAWATSVRQAPRVGVAGAVLPDPKDQIRVLLTYREAVNLIGKGQFEDGLVALRQVLNDSPDMIDVWLHYAGTNVRLGRFEAAYQAYREVIRRKPDETGALLGASAVLQAMNRTADAKKYAELALAHAPAAAHQALANRGACSERDDDEAVRQADLAAQADPGLPFHTFIRGVVRIRNSSTPRRWPSFSKRSEGYAARTSQPNDLHYYIGDSMARLERYREAEPYFKEELRLYPQNTRPPPDSPCCTRRPIVRRTPTASFKPC